MKQNLLHFLHVGSLFLLFGYTFYAFGNPDPVKRKSLLIITGILNLIVLVTGLALLGVMHYGFHGWVLVKLLCWLGLAALLGLVYRRGEKIPLFMGLAILFVLVAVVMVYFKPF